MSAIAERRSGDLRQRSIPVHGRAVERRGEYDCGRLVALDSLDDQTKVARFVTPSHSRKDRAYIVEVYLPTLEASCGCEAMDDFREGGKMPYRFDAAAQPVEVLAKAKGIPFAATLTRPPRALCPHLRAVRRWFTRHDYTPEVMAHLAAKAEAKIDAFDPRRFQK